MAGPRGALSALTLLLLLLLLGCFFVAGGASPATDALRRAVPRAAADGGLCEQLLLPQGYPCTEHTDYSMADTHVSLEELEEYNMVLAREFRSEEDAYNFYNEYARSKGFSIRRCIVKDKCVDGRTVVYWRRLVCSCEGYRLQEYFIRNDQKREPRGLTRCGCMAKIEVELDEETGLWRVKSFVGGHVHPLCSADQVAFLRSHRRLTDAKKAEAIELGISGLRTCQIMEVMEKNHGGYDQVGFVSRDLYNFVARNKKERIEGLDAEFTLGHMRAQQEKDPDFFFKYTTDNEGRLRNLFWADAQSRIDYDAFGGVVVFDSTYRVNRYNLPFIPFIGVNHHRSTVIFGCGVLSDESVASYEWLLQTFLEAMNQKHPKSVITDGDLSMARALEKIMPRTDHRLCSWHIEENCKHRIRDPKIAEFRKFIYEPMDPEEFERRWSEYKETYKITENDVWIDMMYRLRKKWSAAYTNGRYFLGMRSNQRSEGLNSRLHNHLDRGMSLVDLVEHYEFCLSRVRQNEAQLDAKASQSVPFTRMTAEPLEKSASHIYTPELFKKVRAEIWALTKWVVRKVAGMDGSERSYEILSIDGMQVKGRVMLSFERAMLVGTKCYCRKMESEDIPCSHVFAVLKNLGIMSIPRCCVRSRWTMQAKPAFPSDRNVNTHVWSEQMDRYRQLRNIGNEALFKASRSKEHSQKVLDFFQSILDDDTVTACNNVASTFGPLPAHFSAAHRPSGHGVLDPAVIKGRGRTPAKRTKR